MLIFFRIQREPYNAQSVHVIVTKCILLIQTTLNIYFLIVKICFKGIAYFSLSCHVKIGFIAINNIRNNFQPCQHHWYDVYLIKAHFSLPYT